ncbi:hypothetical protein [Archangium sp.]|uniref:hypothetical protein n=1 Tax=Archangium sp. TaxID=1872627 RepID=UPI002D52AD7C|nr:hypothetical protein [Archangium sp.]HYO51332.1 hypothetical protein [Archangium sp.]
MQLRVTSVLYLWLLVPLLARAAPSEVDSRLPVLETVVVSEHHNHTYGRGLKLVFEQLRPDPALARFTLEEARAVVGALEEEPREKKPGREQRLLANCLLAVAAGPCVMPRTNVQPSDLEKRLREQYEALYGPSAVPLPVSLENARWFQALMLSPRYMGGGVREAAVEMFSSPTVVLSVASP